MLSLHQPSQKVGWQRPSKAHGVRLSPQMGSGEAEEALSCRDHWEVFQSLSMKSGIVRVYVKDTEECPSRGGHCAAVTLVGQDAQHQHL